MTLKLAPEQTISDPKLNWQPQWLVDIGHGCQCGITIDDHCFVVLVQNCVGGWIPTEWIPPKVAYRLGELAQSESVL